jgi:hypothetical protein
MRTKFKAESTAVERLFFRRATRLEFLEAFIKAGFIAVSYDKWENRPCQVLKESWNPVQ